MIGFLFKDKTSGERIFEKWHERFGQIDDNEEIYLSIIRGISKSNPTHYKVMVTSDHPDSDEFGPDQEFMILSRFSRMTPDTDENLYRFLGDYQSVGCYLMIPVYYGESGDLEFTMELAIGKTKLSVKNACDIKDTDIEMMAVRNEKDNIDEA